MGNYEKGMSGERHVLGFLSYLRADVESDSEMVTSDDNSAPVRLRLQLCASFFPSLFSGKEIPHPLGNLFEG